MRLKNLLSIICAMTLSFTGNATNELRKYTSNSILASGNTVKIRVQEEGIYSFSYEQLRDMGFSNPKKVHLRGYGGELQNENFILNKDTYIDDLTDQPVIDLGDKIVFYLRGTIGYTKLSGKNLVDDIMFTENYTSEYSYYFLHEESSEALRIKEKEEILDIEDAPKSTYTAFLIKKFDDINLPKTGRNWYGSSMKNGDQKNFSFCFSNAIAGKFANISSVVLSASPDSGYFKMSTDIDAKDCAIGPCKDYVTGREQTMTCYAKINSTCTANVNYSYKTKAETGAGYLDYIIASTECQLKANIPFQTIIRKQKLAEKYAVLGATSQTQIWDVSKIHDVKKVPATLSHDSLIFIAKEDTSVGRFIIFNQSAKFNSPEVVGKVNNQNLHSLKDIEYVIITHPDFINQAEELADIHKEEGMSVKVLTPEVIFNEFSSGTPDPTAFRSFMKMLYDNAGKTDYGIYPKYLLLLGDGTYDNCGRLKDLSYNKIITYQAVGSLDESNSYACDDYFGILENSSPGYESLSSNVENVGVGRFPVSKVSEAQAMVDKVKAYQNLPSGSWRTKMVLMADDNDLKNTTAMYHGFIKDAEDVYTVVYNKDPRINVERIYWDNYTREVSGGSSRYPEVTQAIERNFEDGALFMNYLGHSSYNAISGEHSLSISHAKSLINKIYPLWYSSSCNLSQYDDFRSSLGEELVLNPNGGAIATIAADRTAYQSNNTSLNKKFVAELFNPENEYRLGTIFKNAKTKMGSDNNKMVFCLLGDPALKIKVPELNVVMDSIMEIVPYGAPVRTDTMKALSKILVSGHIEDEDSTLLDIFNGILTSTLKDKEQTIKTKANNPKFTPYEYKDRQSSLYVGSCEVKNGRFQFTIMIPKDINYKVGNGRFSFYAYDETNELHAMGLEENVLVGGSTPYITEDNVGPEIVLSANGNRFNNGYKVNPTPMLYVSLSDISGINASGSGIGHDLTLTIDDDNKNVYSMNSSFQYNMGSCTEGKISFHVPTLSEGWHTLKVKAWDLQNNSSEAELNIYVSNSLAPEIEYVAVYPNPVKDKFILDIKTNRPDEVQTLSCLLTDFSGRAIAQKEITDKTADGSIRVEWDVNEKNKISAGIYLLYMRVTTGNSDFAEKTEKIVVIAQ